MIVARRNFILGLSSLGLVAPATAPGAGAYRPDSSVLPLLGDLANDIARASPVPAHFVHEPAFIGEVPTAGGVRLLVFDSALELDTDGWPSGCGDPSWQETTSLRYLNNQSLDADRVPYFVLPGPLSWPRQFGITLGDYAAVLFQGRVAFAVFGDSGPPSKLGEGSIELLRRLGQERKRRDGCIINAGTAPGVLTIVFPDSHTSGDRQDEEVLLEAIESSGRAHFLAAGGKLPTHG